MCTRARSRRKADDRRSYTGNDQYSVESPRNERGSDTSCAAGSTLTTICGPSVGAVGAVGAVGVVGVVGVVGAGVMVTVTTGVVVTFFVVSLGVGGTPPGGTTRRG